MIIHQVSQVSLFQVSQLPNFVVIIEICINSSCSINLRHSIKSSKLFLVYKCSEINLAISFFKSSFEKCASLKQMFANYLYPEGVLFVTFIALRAMYYTQIHDQRFQFWNVLTLIPPIRFSVKTFCARTEIMLC